MTLSEKIGALRRQKGFSQEDLAAMMNITRQAVSRWEQGESLPDIENILRLSEIFDVTVDYLLKDGGLGAVRPVVARDEVYVDEIIEETEHHERTLGYRLYKKLFSSGFVYAITAIALVLYRLAVGEWAFVPYGHIGQGIIGLPFAVLGLTHWALYAWFGRQRAEEEEQERRRQEAKRKQWAALEANSPGHKLYNRLFRSYFIYYIGAAIYVGAGFLLDTWGSLWGIFVLIVIAHYAMAAWLGIDDDDED